MCKILDVFVPTVDIFKFLFTSCSYVHYISVTYFNILSITQYIFHFLIIWCFIFISEPVAYFFILCCTFIFSGILLLLSWSPLPRRAKMYLYHCMENKTLYFCILWRAIYRGLRTTTWIVCCVNGNLQGQGSSNNLDERSLNEGIYICILAVVLTLNTTFHFEHWEVVVWLL